MPQDESRPSIWVIVPAFNERERISRCLEDLLGSGNYNIVVIDDGSSDATCERVRDYPVWLLRHPINCGQGAALRTGMEFALRKGAEFLITFDSDGQHDAADIPNLLTPLVRGTHDVSLGTRLKGRAIGIPLSRKLLLWLATRVTRLTTGLNLTDVHNGLRGFSRHAAEQIEIYQPRMAHASEILDQISQKRLRYTEVPVTVRYTEETLRKGQSTLDAAKIGSELIVGKFVK